jgi:hypothetical protein
MSLYSNSFFSYYETPKSDSNYIVSHLEENQYYTEINGFDPHMIIYLAAILFSLLRNPRVIAI